MLGNISRPTDHLCSGVFRGELMALPKSLNNSQCSTLKYNNT